MFKHALIVVLALFSLGAQADAYKLASGDVIRVSVLGEPDLTNEEVHLNDSGTFSYPFLGAVKALGKTTDEIERVITKGLSGDYLKDPKVSVSVVEYRPFYIGGEVKAPGGYPYKPGLTMDRAIALAGGLTERASVNRININRGGSAKAAQLATPVEPGDTITIDQGFF
ncbi:polysaccharide biosynthesis/export family protein [Pseudomonas rhizosphaerae]|jgi:protein involved in polysaccharide export with SLBB domain|uniref:Capsular biosynthesis protein n=1 Tax=Pseudomonas rhizosphaerae TaxID=216142 RepID=A0A089YSV0_9PSED|nr:polysaccharide biosynthesis/export family protein [Pseudomonas rhizosphaerae]AIS17447.1 capsular biosynthesis protein [Pseudomonas rhizosphaerae]MBD8612119.1 polysaccharide export protein [Pseudomonas putida]MEB2869575.1 polysaccharide biosynthesis/export family protein [Pseudomonas rhizosphaerae]